MAIIIDRQNISKRPCVNAKYRDWYFSKLLLELNRYSYLFDSFGLDVYVTQSPISESIYLQINEATIRVSEHKNDMDFLKYMVLSLDKIHFNKVLLHKIIKYRIQ
jgi:hypothetical protein